MVTRGPGTPLGGGAATARPMLHGFDRAMQAPKATPMSTTIKQVKVNKSPYVYLANNICDTNLEQTNHDL
jgi:hypothetical protein